MYDELIKRLRNESKYALPSQTRKALVEAADVIEELEIVIAGLNEAIKGLADDSDERRTHKSPIGRAVSVQSHGRLIDADALIAVYERQIERHKEQAEKAAMKGAGYTNDMFIIDRNRDIISALKAAPTIISADEE